MSHLRLYEHPANRRLFGVGVPRMYITGNLPGYYSEQAYEGRLQVVNAGGNCTATLVAGTLPAGGVVSMDDDTKEIVVTWPAYTSSVVAIPNAGLEAPGGWEFGAGWSRTNDNPVSGAYAAQYVDQSGDSLLINSVRSAITPDTSITGSCAVRQGASSEGNAGACVLLQFYDDEGAALPPVEGNLVDQGSNNETKPSTVTTVAPSSAASVSIGARGFRKRQNKKVWVDDFVWNLTQDSIGTNGTDPIGPITIRVRDTLGRETEWTGMIFAYTSEWWGIVRTATTVNQPKVWIGTDGETFPYVATRSPNKTDATRMLSLSTARVLLYTVASSSIEIIDDPQAANMSTQIVSAFSVKGGSDLAEHNGLVVGIVNGTKNWAYSTDGGLSFTTVVGPGSERLVNITRLDNLRWICATGQTGPGFFYYSDAAIPGPSDWTNAGSVSGPGGLGGAAGGLFVKRGLTVISFDPASNVFTTVGGGSWTESDKGLGAFSAPTTGLACTAQVFVFGGSNGEIIRTLDGGSTYLMSYVNGTGADANNSIQGMDYDPINNVLLAWSTRRAWRSTDQGASFTPLVLPQPTNFADIVTFMFNPHGAIRS